MATAGTYTHVFNSTTLMTGGSNQTATVDLTGGYGATVNIRLTNGGVGPTVPAQVAVNVANDYNAGSPTLPLQYAIMQGNTAAAAVSTLSLEIPMGWRAVQIVAGSNTGQPVTVDADVFNMGTV